MVDETINVEVAYGNAQQQVIIPLWIAVNSSAEQAIAFSGILQRFPEIDLTKQKIGIFSQICGLEKIVSAGDRIEIYRPLTQNPMDARRSKLNKA